MRILSRIVLTTFALAACQPNHSSDTSADLDPPPETFEEKQKEKEEIERRQREKRAEVKGHHDEFLKSLHEMTENEKYYLYQSLHEDSVYRSARIFECFVHPEHGSTTVLQNIGVLSQPYVRFLTNGFRLENLGVAVDRKRSTVMLQDGKNLSSQDFEYVGNKQNAVYKLTAPLSGKAVYVELVSKDGIDISLGFFVDTVLPDSLFAVCH